MAEGDFSKQLAATINAIGTVFAFLVLAVLVFGLSLWRLVGNLDDSWTDPRLWLCVIFVVAILVITFFVVRWNKTDPERLLEPTVDRTSIKDSEAVEE